MQLTKSWDEFNAILNRNPDVLKAISENCWRQIESSLGILPKLRRAEPILSKFDDMRLSDIFDYLKNRIESSIPDGLERKTIRYAINYLKCQAKSKTRDQNEIKKTWKDIYSALAKASHP